MGAAAGVGSILKTGLRSSEDFREGVEALGSRLAELPFTGDQLVCLGHDQAAWSGSASTSLAPAARSRAGGCGRMPAAPCSAI
jgi:hypothetical protein